MRVIKGLTFSDVYRDTLNALWNDPEHISAPRGKKIKEILNLITIITDPTSNMFKNDARSIPKRYLAGELYWYLTGRNDLEFIKEYSAFWAKLANDDKTINSAYGRLLFNEKNKYGLTEWQWAFTQLKNDKDTRQAIIRFNKPNMSFTGNKDFVCTLNGIFNIRDDLLHLTIIMRSQDEILGRTFDVPFFSLLLQQMRSHLLPIYPNLRIGTLTQHNVSSHIYSDKFDLVQKMISVEFMPDKLPELKEDLIDTIGNFDEESFRESNDPLKVWIKVNMQKEMEA